MSQSNKDVGSAYERKVKSQIQSGGLWFAPLDLSTDKHCIECKYTDQKGYRINLKLLDKIWNQSLSINKEPILVIGIKKNDQLNYRLVCQLTLEKV